MKTREQIMINASSTLIIVDKYVDECTEGLNKEVINGGNIYECIIDEHFHNSVKEGKVVARELANKLVSLGFHAKYGWRETTPNGNERAIVMVSINKFEDTEKSKIKDIIIIAILYSLPFLISLLIMFITTR